jgi:MFS transporter, BCD family, chlorophyll transporter
MKLFGWVSIARLALVQACLGAVVVLTTSTLNRIMVVELGLAAVVPGFLVAWHYVVQLVRPRMGFASDQGRRLTHWILAGMAILASGGFLAAFATSQIQIDRLYGLGLATLAFSLIGIGVSCCGTSLLVMLAKYVDDNRRAPAATMVWTTMIAGFVISAAVTGKLLDPFSFERLLQISGVISSCAFALTCLLLYELEPPLATQANTSISDATQSSKNRLKFFSQLKVVWQEPASRRFTIFIFMSMLAFNAQDLILEPFAGFSFALTPGQTTSLSGLQHAGVLCGMLLVALVCSTFGRQLFNQRITKLETWIVGGCIASALAMFGLVGASLSFGQWPLSLNVFLLGLANGAFSIAAISSMMKLARDGVAGREGTRMGLWGAAQAIAFGLGGMFGAACSDLAKFFWGHAGFAAPSATALGYGTVFSLEVVLFLAAAVVALKLNSVQPASTANETRTCLPIQGNSVHEL